ncbi:MAG: ParB/RepB/Spo0J family partition protein [Tenuifilum sp.]|uniref:ParB/RepB/Spo0J family partition protein n=2 Tax=Tenuifilum sp. TaxID=2760880 RepID=UPI002BC603C0|nr:ParB/RepB/Spo0J family partition protein [Tenuifilum sp.]HOK86761.1 ParB/RepB/Spo0J family partition protein [Tenuifilum sp.]HON70046.1 ParB/RepB/Spo0J family partition protein [Tenuifilum sp.]HOU75207.1 ParB/RepB/Spo0J family partition protein [Tenuifilum sp.]HPP91103.1 ParB/RepB/Spo0J family partition protein [Tenuifilum sp.]
MSKKMALGKGLGALIDDAVDPTRNQDIKTEKQVVSELVNEIEIEKIDVNPYQPRTQFDEEALKELAESISKLGVIQPLTVRAVDGRFQLISGERRLRAAKLAGLKTIPVFIRTADDQGMLEMALVENIQREDLNAIEVAISYQRLIEECNLTQETLSERVGKKRATISNYLRLLKLPAEIQLGISQDLISMGHARALITIEDPKVQLDIYHQTIAEGLSVRRVEELARMANDPTPVSPAKTKDGKEKVNLGEQEIVLKDHLTNRLGLRADVKPGPKGDGKIVISYNNQAELEAILEKFIKIEE